MLADSPEELICLAATDSTLAATDSTAPIGVVPIENSGNTASRLVLSRLLWLRCSSDRGHPVPTADKAVAQMRLLSGF